MAEDEKESPSEEELYQKLKDFKVFPLECCPYPKLVDNTASRSAKCSALCKSLPSPPFRCVRSCLVTETGVIVRGTFNASEIFDEFYATGDSNTFEPITKDWDGPLKASINDCSYEIIDKTDIKDEDCIYFYTKFTECVRRQNFINCPNYNSNLGNGKCKNIMEIVKNLTSIDLLRQYFFEDFYYRELTYPTTITTTTKKAASKA